MKGREIMRGKKKNYIADFETEYLTKKQIEDGAQTYVWAWSLRECETLEEQQGSDIDSFIAALQKIPYKQYNVWFHNLKFDFQFLLSWLLRNDYKQVQSNKKMQYKTFSSLVSINATYSCEVKFKNSQVLFLDSYKKLPFKVSKIAKDLHLEVLKGEIDYKKHREEGAPLDPIDSDYISRDTYIVAVAMKQIFFDHGLTKRTIGADCIAYYKQTQPNFFKYFPKLSEEIIEDIKPAYKGGNVVINAKKRGKLLTNGRDFDMNGMHSFVESSASGYLFPFGAPVKFEGGYIRDPRHLFYIQKFSCSFKLKKGMQPAIQTSLNGLYNQQEYITDTYGQRVELTLCCYDLDLFFKHYDVQNIELLGGYKFQARRGMFDQYINYWAKIKEEGKAQGNYVQYITGKLFLNNLAGKFAQGAASSNQIFNLDDEGIVERKPIHGEKETLYLPVAIAVTAAARSELYKVIDAAGDAFVYCDTDSCKIDRQDLDLPIDIHPTRLGAWKHENDWEKAIYVRPKTYAECIDGKWKVTGAGMNDEVKEEVIKAIEKDPKSFKTNAEFPGKLMTKRCKGGVVLQETTFKIRA